MSNLGFRENLLDGAEVEWRPLGEVCNVLRGKRLTKDKLSEEFTIPVFHGGLEPLGFFDKSNRPGNSTMIINVGASAGTVGYSDKAFWSSDGCYCISHSEILDSKFLFHYLRNVEHHIIGKVRYAGIPTLDAIVIERLLVPIPCPEEPEKSLAIQGEIVRILDSFTQLTAELTAELEARKKQYNHYRDQLTAFEDRDVEWKALGDVFDILAGGDAPTGAISSEQTEEFNIPILSNGIGERAVYGWTNKAKIEKPSLTVSARGTIGWTGYREEPFFPIVRLIVLTPKTNVNLRFAYHFMKTIENGYQVPTTGIPQLTRPMIQSTPFPIPFADDPERSLKEQACIVAILDKFDTLTTSLSEGLPREIALRQKQYEYYRDLLLSFPKPAELTAQ